MISLSFFARFIIFKVIRMSFFQMPNDKPVIKSGVKKKAWLTLLLRKNTRKKIEKANKDFQTGDSATSDSCVRLVSLVTHLRYSSPMLSDGLAIGRRLNGLVI